jgi:hypothetical protein
MGAVLPEKLAELLKARAEVLERHTRALDPDSEAGSRELEAYLALVRAHRAVAADLDRLAQQMSGYRNMPMAAHDAATMRDPRGQAEAYEHFQRVEHELAELLNKA